MTKNWSPSAAAATGLIVIIFSAIIVGLAVGRSNISIWGGFFVAFGAVAEIVARVYEEKSIRERTIVGRVLHNDCIVEAVITEGKRQKSSDIWHEVGLTFLGVGGLLVGFGPIL